MVDAITYTDGMSLKRKDKKDLLSVFPDVGNTDKNAEWSALVNSLD